MNSKKLKSRKLRKSKKFRKSRKSRNNKQYGGNDECSIKVRRNDYKEEVNYYKDKNCDAFYYEDNNNFYKLRKRNKYNIFGKTRCTSNPPSGTLRERCKNNRILQSSEINSNNIFELSSDSKIARHNDKTNIAFLDGHIESMPGSTLLSKTGYQTDFWTP